MKFAFRWISLFGPLFFIAFLALVPLVPLQADAQSAADLLAKMHRVAAQTSLDAVDAKPLHLKMTVQLYDSKGRVTETGTVEDWMAGPKMERRVYSMPSFSATQVHTPERFYRTPGSGSAPYLVDYLLSLVLHPMASDQEIDGAKLDLRKETFGKNAFDCVMLDQPIKNLAFPPFALFPTYCLDHDKEVLRIAALYGNQVAVMSKKGIFRGVDVALDPTVSISSKEVASATVTLLRGQDEPYAETQAIDGMEAVDVAATPLSGGIVAGNILEKLQPIYPEKAKANHVSGTILLHAIIGTDGRIRLLKLISAPDPDLAVSAIAAVRQWRYKPYLLNGVPAEVDTTVTVNYSLSPR